MASIERTAYPRFRHDPNARELQNLFTPTDDEISFGRSLVRSGEHLFAAVVLLKCLQYMGYFPELSEVPASIRESYSCLPSSAAAGDARL